MEPSGLSFCLSNEYCVIIDAAVSSRSLLVVIPRSKIFIKPEFTIISRERYYSSSRFHSLKTIGFYPILIIIMDRGMGYTRTETSLQERNKKKSTDLQPPNPIQLPILFP